MASIIVNASTSLVNINSSNITPGTAAVVLLSSVNSPGAIVTIRDYAGFCSTNRRIIVSTTSDTQFIDGSNISSFEIVTPYGFFTVSPRDASFWTVLNSFAFGTQANASVDSLVVTGQITSDRILNANTFSTAHLQTSSATATAYLSTPFVNINTLLANQLTTSSLFTSNIFNSNIISTPFIQVSNAVVTSILSTKQLVSEQISSQTTNTSSLFVNGVNIYLVTSTNLITNQLFVSSILPSTAGLTIVMPTAFQLSTLYASTIGVGGITITPPQALLDLRGGGNDIGTFGFPILSIQSWVSGYRHWVTSRNYNASNSSGNAIDFFVNNSASQFGSSNPGAGNCNMLSITGAGVGIGVSTPSGMLEVAGTSATAEVVALYLRNNSTPTSNVTTMSFGTAATSVIGQAQIAVGNVGAAGAGYMALRTYSTSMTEKVRIMDTGFVGINTSSPRSILDLMQPSGSNALSIQNNSNTGNVSIDFYNHVSTYVGSIGYGNSNSASGGNFQDKFWIYHNAKDCVFLGSNANERMRVTSAGNIGIGTSTPTTRLHVVTIGQTVSSCVALKSADVDMCLGFIGGAENSGAIQVFSGGVSSNFGTNPYILRLQPHGGITQVGNCNTTATLWVSTSRVGINTTTPASAFNVYTANRPASITYSNGEYGVKINDNCNGGILYGNDITHSIFFRVGRDNTTDVTDFYEYGFFRWFTNGNIESQTEKMRLTAAGNLGIGTPTPSNKLEVNGVGYASSYFKHPGSIVGVSTSAATGLSLSGYGNTLAVASITYTPKQSGTVTLHIYGHIELYFNGGSGDDALNWRIDDGPGATTYSLQRIYLSGSTYLGGRGSGEPILDSLGRVLTTSGTKTWYLRLGCESDDTIFIPRCSLIVEEYAN